MDKILGEFTAAPVNGSKRAPHLGTDRRGRADALQARRERLSDRSAGGLSQRRLPTAQPRPPLRSIPPQLSSSFFPYYLPNLNTGADNIGVETTRVVAQQKASP